MSTENDLEHYGRLSLVSVVLTAVAITVNHAYVLGTGAFALGAVLSVVPAASWWWFRKTRSNVAFTGYMLVNLWMIVGFGAIKGLWETTLPLFLGTLLSSLSTGFPKPPIRTFGFEASGLLTFIGSAFVLFYALKLLQVKHETNGGGAQSGRTRAHLNVGLAASAAVAVAVVTGAYALTDQDRWVAPANGVVKIGVIVPTNGPYAVLGNSFVKAVQMANDDLKGTKYHYQLVIEDSGSDPSKARDVIRKVVQEEKVDALVGGVSLIGQVTKPYATKARIPHACVCSVMTVGDGAYNFTNIPSPEAEATRWVQEAQRRGIKTVALLTMEYPSINNHVTALRAEAARDGVRVVSEQRFDAAVTDFRSTIANAQSARPDVYFVEGFNPALDRLAQQLSDAGIHNIASVVAPSVSEKPALFEGAWYTDSDLVDIGFRARFEAKYPDTQFAMHMMPYAYDSFNMIVQAYEHGQNPAVYMRNLTKYNGTAGELTKAAGSGNFQSTPTVWMIRNGKPTLLN